MNWVLWGQILIPLITGICFVFLSKENHRSFRILTLVALCSVLLLGCVYTPEGMLWLSVLQGESLSVHFYFGLIDLSLSATPFNTGLLFALLIFLITLIGGHPFHSKDKMKPFVIVTLLVCALLQACFMVDNALLSMILAMTTHLLFWVLMTQMGTGRRSLISLRIFSVFIVVDTFAIGFHVAPESMISYAPFPWAMSLGALLGSWIRLGIFPFHSIYRWAAQSIGPSATVLFTVCQILIGIHFLPVEFLNSASLQTALEVFTNVVIFHLLWLGILSIGEKRAMMILIHGLLCITAFTVILTPQIKGAFTLYGPWPWAMPLFAIFGLFADELHNLKNDILASFEHAQVGLLTRWPQMHLFAQSLVFIFAVGLIALPLRILWLPNNNLFENPPSYFNAPHTVFLILGCFSFCLLSIYGALFQLWRRWNTRAPVERIALPEGAEEPIVWRWHLSGCWALLWVFWGCVFYFF